MASAETEKPLVAGAGLETHASNKQPTEIANGSAELPSNKEKSQVAGVRKTPFESPADGVSPTKQETLTTEHETYYNSLLNEVSTWTYVPSVSPSNDSLPLTDAERMWLTRDCLLRYLRASKWSLHTAKERLASTLQWRRTYGLTILPPSDAPRITAEHISPENETGKQWIQGYDNEGRPCLYLNPSRQNTKRSDRQIEHLVFMLERVIDLTPPGQETLALLINFAETRSGQGATIGQGKQVLNILQNHYPERLGRALLCNLPWHFWAFMKLITPFIDPLTRKKLVYDSPLENHIPPPQLCKSHGGTLDFEYDHAVYWPELNRLADERRAAMAERWERGGKMIGEYENYLKGGTLRSLKDDLDENPNAKNKGKRLGGSGSGSATPRRERGVKLISDKDEDDEATAASEMPNGTQQNEVPVPNQQRQKTELKEQSEKPEAGQQT